MSILILPTGGGTSTKAAVRLATATALPGNARTSNTLTADVNGDLGTIDGVTAAVGNRILVKNEATGANNGWYVVDSVGSAGTKWAMTRSTDADTSAEIVSGVITPVQEGTANGDKLFMLTTNAPITINVTALVFTVASGSGTVTSVTSANTDIGVATGTTTPVLTLNSSTTPTADKVVKRDANANTFSNNYFVNTTSTVSAAGTTILTVASARTQTLTGSSTQTFQLPDATTLSLSSIFEFNNNSSGTLVITNAGAATQYTIPAGGSVICYCTSIGSANGTWDFHPLAPLSVTWGSGVTGLVMNSVLTTSPSLGSGASSSIAPSFIPQRGASTTGFGGDGTNLYATIAGTARVTISGTGITATNLSGTNTGDQTAVVALRNATTDVSTSAAAAPSSGQVLTATANNTATWQTPSGGSVIDATVEVSSAEIKALNATPKTLIAAPASGYMNILLSGIQVSLDYGGTAYTIGTTNNIRVKYKNGTGPNATELMLTTGFFDATADQIGIMPLLVTSVPMAATNFAAQPIVLYCGFAGELTLGNGTLHIHFKYAVIPTGL